MNGESAQRIYTLKQATKSLKVVSAGIIRLKSMVRDLKKMEVRIAILEIICGQTTGIGSSDVKELLALRQRYHTGVTDLQDVESEWNANGVMIVHTEPALVHFLTRKSGLTVYLCWRDGEKSVHHWHPLDQDCQEDDMQRHLVRRRDGFI